MPRVWGGGVRVSIDYCINLTRGYLFRLTPTGGIQDSPFSSAAVEACLKVYLKKMGADDGEHCMALDPAVQSP